MAIKVTLGATENTQQEKPFPKLMIANLRGSIILATGEDGKGYLGTLLHKGESGDTLGEYSTIWDKRLYTDYNEPITIQNL
jgi:hypothetical protein